MASLMPIKNMYVVRHLKREDENESREWNTKYSKNMFYRNNPMLVMDLTKDSEAKRHLDKLLEELSSINFKYIVASPFLRCIETAEIIRQLKGIDKINVHFGLSELVEDSLFETNNSKNPFYCGDGKDHILDIEKVFAHTSAHVKSELPLSVLEESVSYSKIKYETDPMYDERIRRVMNEIFDKFDDNVLIVTHNYALRWSDSKLSLKYGDIYPVRFPVRFPMSGGYYSKYLKYKQKYLRLKNKI